MAEQRSGCKRDSLAYGFFELIVMAIVMFWLGWLYFFAILIEEKLFCNNDEAKFFVTALCLFLGVGGIKAGFFVPVAIVVLVFGVVLSCVFVTPEKSKETSRYENHGEIYPMSGVE